MKDPKNENKKQTRNTHTNKHAEPKALITKRFVMIKVNSIDHVNMDVKNLQKSLDFYKSLFSFEEKERGTGREQRPWAIIGISGKLMYCLYETDQTVTASNVKHIGLNVDNFDQTLETLKAKNIELLYGGVTRYPKSRSLYIEDPDGNEIEISEFIGGGL